MWWRPELVVRGGGGLRSGGGLSRCLSWWRDELMVEAGCEKWWS